MSKTVLITGGAGFIGSHLADELLAHGYRVRVLDNLCEQVHGKNIQRPDYLDPQIDLVTGDIRDPRAVRGALHGVNAVFHYAAMVGVGQSMYQVEKYTAVNNMGTAVLLEELIRHPVEKLIVASSMSIYGEGLYRDEYGTVTDSSDRDYEKMKKGDWEVRDINGRRLTPCPTPESKMPSLASVYALSKFDQERLCLMIGKAYHIPTISLRFFNVYGTRQSLMNPYTGVLAIFASRLLNNNPPLIFEDGMQRRDFVSVRDIAYASRLALETPGAAYEVMNIGSGESYSILEVAQKLAVILGREEIAPEITGEYRVGDIRHCFADITLARRLLGYSPEFTLDKGLTELADWLREQKAVDRFDEARKELAERGLTV